MEADPATRGSSPARADGASTKRKLEPSGAAGMAAASPSPIGALDGGAWALGAGLGADADDSQPKVRRRASGADPGAAGSTMKRCCSEGKMYVAPSASASASASVRQCARPRRAAASAQPADDVAMARQTDTHSRQLAAGRTDLCRARARGTFDATSTGAQGCPVSPSLAVMHAAQGKTGSPRLPDRCWSPAESAVEGTPEDLCYKLVCGS